MAYTRPLRGTPPEGVMLFARSLELYLLAAAYLSNVLVRGERIKTPFFSAKDSQNRRMAPSLVSSPFTIEHNGALLIPAAWAVSVNLTYVETGSFDAPKRSSLTPREAWAASLAWAFIVLTEKVGIYKGILFHPKNAPALRGDEIEALKKC